MPKTYCPECEAVISVDNPQEGATVHCRECGVELEVIAIDPFEVDYPLDYDLEEDWEEEEDD